jgi:diguanylate cyclase (GGDEF)-like protein
MNYKLNYTILKLSESEQILLFPNMLLTVIEIKELLMFLFLLTLFIYVLAASSITTLHKAYLSLHSVAMLWPLSQYFFSISPDGTFKWLWINIAFSSIFLLGFVWFIFALVLTRQTHLLKGRNLLLISTPVVFIIIFISTNPYHHLFAQPVNGSWKHPAFGFSFWIFFLITVTYVFFATLIILRELRLRAQKHYKKQIQLLLWGPSSTVILGAVDALTNILINPSSGVSTGWVSLGIVISATCFVIAITKYDLIKIVHIAQREVIDNMTGGVIVLDTQDVIIDINKSATIFLSPFIEVKAGQNLYDVFHALSNFVEDIELFNLFLEKYSSRSSKPLQIFQREIGLKQLCLSINISPLIDNKGYLLGRVVALNDITDLKKLISEVNHKNEQLEIMSITDQLTGLYNRTYIMRHLVKEIERAISLKSPVSLILFDLDHFKSVNDKHGHLTGDKVLQKTTDIIKLNLRPSDVPARYGGEEFIIFAPKTDLNTAQALAEKLRSAVEDNIIKTASGHIKVTISLGVTSINYGLPPGNKPAKILDRLLLEADSAMYRAKSKGRNCIESTLLDPLEYESPAEQDPV